MPTPWACGTSTSAAGADLHGQGGHAGRVEPRARDRTPVPQPVPGSALRQCGIARPDLDRLLDGRLRHPRVRPRRLRHLPHRRRRARHHAGRDDARRAANWEYLFNPATGYLQARGQDGSFPPGQAFETSQFEPGGRPASRRATPSSTPGMSPRTSPGSPRSWAGTGRDRQAETYFTQLNARPLRPYDWSGNEPDEWAPWAFDYFGAPARPSGSCGPSPTAVRRRTGRRTGKRRPRRDLLVVRVGRARPLPRDPGTADSRWQARSSRTREIRVA